MIQNIGIPGLVILLVIALIIFGPSKLPEIGRACGTTLREFKRSTRDLLSGDEDSERKKSKTDKAVTNAEDKKNALIKMEKSKAE